MSQTIEAARAEAFREAVESAVHGLATIEHRSFASFVRTPVLYPSGSTVVVECRRQASGVNVSDAGYGYREADLLGATNAYNRHAEAVGRETGVHFNGLSFDLLDVDPRGLAGAIMTIASCSQEAVAVTTYRHSERRASTISEELVDRLEQTFSPENVERGVDVPGFSTTLWRFAAMLRPPNDPRHPVIFEPVTRNQTSVAFASMKFSDVARVEGAPRRVAVVRNHTEFGTLLSVLTQSASVIELQIPASSLFRLARMQA